MIVNQVFIFTLTGVHVFNTYKWEMI